VKTKDTPIFLVVTIVFMTVFMFMNAYTTLKQREISVELSKQILSISKEQHSLSYDYNNLVDAYNHLDAKFEFYKFEFYSSKPYKAKGL